MEPHGVGPYPHVSELYIKFKQRKNLLDTYLVYQIRIRPYQACICIKCIFATRTGPHFPIMLCELIPRIC